MSRQHYPHDLYPRDFEEVFGVFQERVQRWGKRKIVGIVLAVLPLVWLASGLYVVGPGERGPESTLASKVLESLCSDSPFTVSLS
jgi:hypothetical protein